MAKKKTSIFKKILIFLFVIIFLGLLGVSAFAASIYFGVLDNEKVAWVNEKIGLYKLPLIGAGQEFEYFAVPEGVVWPPPPEPEPEPEPAPTDTPTAVAEKPKPEPPKNTATDDKKSKDVKVSQKELEEQMKAREAAEKKRISKLARIYDNMKPEEAAKALNDVSLDTVVLILQKMNEANAGQVIAKMEPSKAARVTQMLFDGQQRRLTLPSDYQ
ncbi:MAG: magnesium transporter MgtE [Selenomonadaceae bacterium]|nr:magnesium transporter MgtE [Selenomonadaceae bacterium]MBQ7628703.1 magnesium transporter MgtE [Selenomonadaceae bacterium]